MKKVAIIIKTLEAGGIEKSLINLLNFCDKKKYKIDLFLFEKKGSLFNQLSKNININIIEGDHFLITNSQAEAKNKGFFKYLKRSFCALYSKWFGNKIFIKKMLKKIKVKEEYDVVINYQITPNSKRLFYGPSEVALTKFKDAKKILFIHSDFESAGLNNECVHNQLKQYEKLIFVSKSCLNKFLKLVPEYSEKADYIYNIHNVEEIKSLSKESLNVKINKNTFNLIMVARLSEEKAHIRALSVLAKLKEEGYTFNLHIVGDGPLKTQVEEFIKNNNMQNFVFMYGDQSNPYKFLAQCDLLMLVSLHEAAPMVIGESYILGVPVLSTNTISANELIADKHYICENNENAIYLKLKEIFSNNKKIKAYKDYIKLNDENFVKLTGIIENI